MRCYVYKDSKWNYWMLYPWEVLTSDSHLSEWTLQEVSEEDIHKIKTVQTNVYETVNKILSNYL